MDADVGLVYSRQNLEVLQIFGMEVAQGVERVAE
jgi:hypothetical protein